MKKLLINIWALNYHAKFEILAEDNAIAVEKAILDKLGENSIKWDYLGERTLDRRIKRITYEEVIYDPGPLQTKEILGVTVATGALGQ